MGAVAAAATLGLAAARRVAQTTGVTFRRRRAAKAGTKKKPKNVEVDVQASR